MTNNNINSTVYRPPLPNYCAFFKCYCVYANSHGNCESTACRKINGSKYITYLCPKPIGEECEYAIRQFHNVICPFTECIDHYNRILYINEGVTDTMEIKDSGERTEFESGAVRDMHEGKGRMDLLPWEAIMEVSKHCENGAKKYGEHNVDKGIPVHSFCDSAMRHMAKYMSGWEDENHLLAAAWNILWAVQMHITHPELVDVPWDKSK